MPASIISALREYSTPVLDQVDQLVDDNKKMKARNRDLLQELRVSRESRSQGKPKLVGVA